MHTITKSIAIFITATPVLNAIAPALAQTENNAPSEVIAGVERFIGEEDVRGDARPFRNARVRVHVHAISKKRIIGRIVSMTQDTLVIEGTGWIFMPGRRTPVEKGRTLYRVPLSAITNTEVSMGQRRNTGKGLSVGLGLGITLFLIAASLGPLLDTATVAIVPSSICLLSTLIGVATKTEKWVEVPPQHLSLSIAPTPDKGLRAARTVNF